MIRLRSNPSAAALSRLRTCKAVWEQKISEGSDDGSIPDCYRHEDVKAAIKAETEHKCAYCESKITATYWGDVEHILPKSARRDLALEYDNLTLACAICNNRKGTYYHPDQMLVDPYRNEPGREIVFAGPFFRQRLGSRIGKLTINKVDLNRVGLIERRLERWNMMVSMAETITREPEGPLRDELIRELEDYAEPSKEFSAMAAALLRNLEAELDSE